MNVAFDPKLIDHLELRENALKERDARALYQMAQIYASMKGKKEREEGLRAIQEFCNTRICQSTIHDGAVQRERDRSQAKPFQAVTWYIRAEISCASDIADRSDTPMKWIGSGCTFSVRSRALPQN